MKKMNMSEDLFMLLSKYGHKIEVFNHLMNNYTLIALGGVVRDYLFHYEKGEPRDIDLVVIGANNITDIFKLFITEYSEKCININQCNGLKISQNSFSVDLWRIEDTIALKGYCGDIPPTVLINTVFLNIDAFAYNLNTCQFVCNCDRKPFPCEIDIQFFEESTAPLNYIRALVNSKKYNIPISITLKKKIIEYGSTYEGHRRLGQLYVNHYGNALEDFNSTWESMIC